MPKKQPDDLQIGKFDILATYAYAQALLEGETDDKAKQRGIVAAIMGAKARRGEKRDHLSEKKAAEKKSKSSITAASFDHQVADKMGDFFDDVFLPGIKALAEGGLSYPAVKLALKIPSTWGAKISGAQFKERVKAALKKRRGSS